MSGAGAPGAELRVVRLLTVGAGLASALALMLLFAVDHFGAARPAVDGGWFRGLGWTTMLAPVAVGLVAARLGQPMLRRLNAGLVVLSLLALPAAVALNLTLPVEDRHLPWVLTTVAPLALAALLAGGPRLVAAVVGVTVVANQALRWWTGHVTYSAAINDLHALLTAVVLVSLATSLLHAARRADVVADRARAREGDRAAAEARDEARERAAALVHDEVLVTLLLAARGSTAAMRDAVRRQAHRALTQIRRLSGEDPDDARGGGSATSTRHAVARLRAVASAEDPAVAVVVRGDIDGDVADDAVDALAGALRQALANSVAHAGPNARRAVHVTAADGTIELVVRDDGVGFDPVTVPAERMGIAVSIVGRMRTLAGGDARVDARPGAGTVVTLAWHRRTVATTVPDGDARWLSPLVHVVGRRGWRTVATIFVGGQLLLAMLASAATRDRPLVGLLALAGVLVAATLVWRRPASAPSRSRGLAVVVMLAAVSAVTCAQGPLDGTSYAQLWCLTSAALVLVGLAVAGRPGLAVLGVAASAAVVAWGVADGRVVPVEATVALVRAVNIVALGVLLVVASRRVQAANVRAEAAELAALQVRARRRARGVELAARGRELERLVGDQLKRIADGPALTADERRACAALEGRLRDVHRGGRLARPPLTAAAMDARSRGVDVTLLDDARHPIDDGELDRIARWMQAQLEPLRAGGFTGRILPAGREGIASVVAGGEVAVLPPAAGEAAPASPPKPVVA